MIEQLAAFQKQHGILNTPETLGNGQPTEVEHTAELGEVDALSRELVSATTDRIVLEAEYRAAASGDPELVIASDPKLMATSSSSSALLQQLRTRRSDLEQEQAQLRIEHGPNFPRVVEIRSQMQDLDQQIKAEDQKLVERLKSAWEAATDRERMVRKSLGDATSAGLKVNEAALRYAAMRQETNANRDLYIRLTRASGGSRLGCRQPRFRDFVIDYARQPAKPVSPNLPRADGDHSFCLAVAGHCGSACARVDSIEGDPGCGAACACCGCVRREPCAGADTKHIRFADRRCPHSAIDGNEEPA